VAMNCEILTTTRVSRIGAHRENNGNGLGLIASGVIDIAVICERIFNQSFTCLPLHRDSVVVTNWKLTNLSSNSSFSIRREIGLIVNSLLEVK
jgi:hypothetical protein